MPNFVSLEMFFFNLMVSILCAIMSVHFCYNKRKETGIGTVFQYYYISRKMFVRFSWKTINSGQLCS